LQYELLPLPGGPTTAWPKIVEATVDILLQVGFQDLHQRLQLFGSKILHTKGEQQRLAQIQFFSQESGSDVHFFVVFAQQGSINQNIYNLLSNKRIRIIT
jgi:hypothetical protein